MDCALVAHTLDELAANLRIKGSDQGEPLAGKVRRKDRDRDDEPV